MAILHQLHYKKNASYQGLKTRQTHKISSTTHYFEPDLPLWIIQQQKNGQQSRILKEIMSSKCLLLIRRNIECFTKASAMFIKTSNRLSTGFKWIGAWYKLLKVTNIFP
jgi:hypothetical protein